ncbi:MAG: PGF-pre-PGF domain-containing protein [Candidatus Aenigmarchaeota archaeon]|nr:PGF-pre-PGF domain-containing protein [Candidatus Aenigmarchaeota archaeon]
MKKFLILVAVFALFTISPVFAVTVNMGNDNVTVIDNSGTIVLEVGNLTKNYTLSARLIANQSFDIVNVTFYMPYGIVNMTPCNGGTGFSRVNATTVSCIVAVNSVTQPAPPDTTPIGVTVNLTITANISAFSFYTAAQAFNFTFTSRNVTGIINSTIRNITAVSSRRNPRPEAVETSTSNASLTFTFWNQSDKGYKVMTPIYTFNPTLGRPELANNSYGEILYFDKSFFEGPNFMKLWSYNLTFRIIFTGGLGAANYTIRSPINNSQFPTQSLTPLFIQTNEIQDFITNVTRNFTMGIPNPNSFTAYWNGTNYTQTVLLSSRGLNVSFTGGAAAGSDQSISLLSVSIPNETVANMTNNTDITVLFTMTNITACGTTSCTTSPIFVNSQSISGWSPDSPPQFGSALNISYVMNVTNAFTNYTLDNLSISIMQPMNVTMVSGSRTEQFNMTRLSSVRISVWNGSVFVENLSVIRRESNFSFSDTHGPSGANVTLFITTFDVVLSSSAHVNGSFGWEPNSNGIVLINFTAEMTFPILNETAPPSGAAGTANQYNVTTNQPQRAPLNLTGKVPGLDNSSTGINVTVDGVQVASSNLTIGSLILKDVTSGQHVISVTYSVPAATTTTAATTTVPSGGTTPKKDVASVNAAPGVVSKLKYDEKDIGIKEIQIEVKNSANDVRITVTKLTGQPASVTHTISGRVFQYIEINTENLASDNIKSARVQFNVTKAWLINNSASDEDVILNRYINTTGWQKLKTTKLSESPVEVLFDAETPGFSVFAVTTEKTITTTTTANATTTVPATTAATTTIPAKPADSAAVTFLIAAVLVIAYLLLKRNKRK